MGRVINNTRLITKLISAYKNIPLINRLAIPIVVALFLEILFATTVIHKLKQVDSYTNILQNSLIPNLEKSTTNLTLLKKISENATYAVLSSDLDMLEETEDSYKLITNNLQNLNNTNIKNMFQEYYHCINDESRKMIISGKIDNDEDKLKQMLKLYKDTDRNFTKLDKKINQDISTVMAHIRKTTQMIIYLTLSFIIIFSLIIVSISYLIYHNFNKNIKDLNEKLTQLQLKHSTISESIHTNDILCDISKKIDITMNEFNELEKEKLEAQERAFRDQLTKLYNRHYFNKIFMSLLENYSEFGLIILDIDHFKNVNDKYGHNVGDDVLVRFAEILQYSLREKDIVGRWGGEEFIIIIFSKDENILSNIANKIRKTIEDEIFDEVGKITASFGISINDNHSDINKIIDKADKALYEAKVSGRNKVILYNEDKISI